MWTESTLEPWPPWRWALIWALMGPWFWQGLGLGLSVGLLGALVGVPWMAGLGPVLVLGGLGGWAEVQCART